ncbi:MULTISPECIES: VOC family protein [unclassified Streptomyces]|uniref:VOC family protein n=1 Tax=Actinomycetes TaxID=1760 RepID=UPI0033B24BEC
MSVTSVTHLNFRGDARAALGFYHSVFGGDLAVVSYEEAGDTRNPAGPDQVVWGQVAAENGFRVMAYDVPSQLPWDRGVNSFFVSLRCGTTREVSDHWEKLSVGATVVQPLEPARWAPLHGMLEDRYGVVWVLDVASGENG